MTKNSASTTNKKTLYLDMDGVVADWNKGAREIVGYATSDPKQVYPDHDWEKIKQHEHFYLELDRLPLADELVDLARKFRDDLGWGLRFLTAIPHLNDMPMAFSDKVRWAEKYYPDIPVTFGPYSRDKHHHAKAGDILIDDRKDNCQDWEKAGGKAIHVDSTNLKKTIQTLEEIYKKSQSLQRLKQLDTI